MLLPGITNDHSPCTNAATTPTPESQRESCEPKLLADLVGQEVARRHAKIAVAVSQQRGEPLPHMLLTGISGCGKTTLARVLACEMGVNAIQAMGQLLRTPAQVSGQLMRLVDTGSILFIDEGHLISPPAQTQLFTAMTEGRTVESGGPFRGHPMTYVLPPFTLLIATTDEQQLLKPLRNRFELKIRFDRYADSEVVELLSRRAKSHGIEVQVDAIHAIARRCIGVPRSGLLLLQSALRHAIYGHESIVHLKHAVAAFELAGLDHRGLVADQQHYLRRLFYESPQRVSDLAFALDTSPERVQRVLEPDLVYLGLIRRGSEGRWITREGIDHVRQERQLTHAG